MLCFSMQLLALLPSSLGATVKVDWTISWVSVSPDGFARRAIGVNGEWPIPAIEATLGDVLELTVHNHLDAPTALHSHGKSDGPYA